MIQVIFNVFWYFKPILILTWHELGTCSLETDLSVPGTGSHLVEMSKTCMTWLDWIDSLIHMIDWVITQCDDSEKNCRTVLLWCFMIHASWHYMSWSCEISFNWLWVIFRSKIRSINVPMSKSIFGIHDCRCREDLYKLGSLSQETCYVMLCDIVDNTISELCVISSFLLNDLS